MDLFNVNKQIDELGCFIIPEDMTEEELSKLFDEMIKDNPEE